MLYKFLLKHTSRRARTPAAVLPFNRRRRGSRRGGGGRRRR